MRFPNPACICVACGIDLNKSYEKQMTLGLCNDCMDLSIHDLEEILNEFGLTLLE